MNKQAFIKTSRIILTMVGGVFMILLLLSRYSLKVEMDKLFPESK